MIVLNRTLWILLIVQIVLCVLSAGFSPAILGAIALMLAAPVSFLRSMPAHGIAFLLLPGIAGMVLFQGLIVSPAFLGWLVLIIIASAICWNRGPSKPEFWPTGSHD
jgi:hypothetical protein